MHDRNKSLLALGMVIGIGAVGVIHRLLVNRQPSPVEGQRTITRRNHKTRRQTKISYLKTHNVLAIMRVGHA